ncbi:MAG: DUF420 domain-containing protein [Acidobacteriota bacterium]
MDVHDLPTLNATLNGIATVFLVTGFVLVRGGRIEAHRRAMLGAFACSILFLTSYLVYHSQVGSVRFQSTGTIRTVYLSILLTHVVLAALVPFLAVITLWRGLKNDGDPAKIARHRKIARWTFPIWLYVSITGVVVYWMLYHVDQAG